MTLKVVSVYQSKVKAHPDRVRKDLLGNLISNNLDPKRLYSEAYGNIFAGTDTTTSALGLVALAIIRHPRIYKILVAELDRAFPPGEYVPFASMELQKLETECPYLTCCIKESLRCDPLVPGPNLRVVPKEGTNINGWFVPRDVCRPARCTQYRAVAVGSRLMYRRRSYSPKPNLQTTMLKSFPTRKCSFPSAGRRVRKRPRWGP